MFIHSFIHSDNSIVYTIAGSSDPPRRIPQEIEGTVDSIAQVISSRVVQVSKLEFYDGGGFLVDQRDLTGLPPPRAAEGYFKVLVTQGTV